MNKSCEKRSPGPPGEFFGSSSEPLGHSWEALGGLLIIIILVVILNSLFLAISANFFITLTLIFYVSRSIQMKWISEIESTHRDLSIRAIEISNGRQTHFFEQLFDFSKHIFCFI